MLLLSSLVRQSFFFDGGIYASIARNLAEGVGSAWSPHFSKTLFPIFAEHPPLMMWLEAVGFKIFGDTVLVEKGFSLLTFVVSGLLLFKLWMRLHVGDAIVQIAAPFALLMTLAAGRVNWGFANGMLENLLIVFALTAVLLVVAAYDAPPETSEARRVALVVCAGLSIVLALLTKGPVGLFPLVTPAIYWLSFRRPPLNRVVLDTIIIIGVITLVFTLLWTFDGPREAIQRYYAAQLLSSLSGDRGHFGGGWAVLRKILGVNGYSLAVVALLLIGGRQWREASEDPNLRRSRWQRAVFLLLIGFSASLPLALSPRVVNHYFNPSLAYFSAGLCTICAPVLMGGLGKLTPRLQSSLWFGSIGLLAAGLVVVYLNIGRPGIDKQTILASHEIANTVCPGDVACGTTISACGKIWEDWALHTYMQRYYKISIAKESEEFSTYLISDDNCKPDPAYTDTGIAISPYRLLRR
ncbi:glycosyltransferase family 39 protein [Shinella sumterensis]|nr:glycosyltransferase family 39 protein [Shinella sumterensis]